MIWPEQPEWDRFEVSSPQSHGNFDAANSTIRNVVLAETGPLKDGRGHLDLNGLHRFASLFPPKGAKSRLSHPNATSDGVTRFLGRQTNPRVEAFGDRHRLFGDLVLDPSSRVAPEGDLGNYVWNRAWSDPESFATSVVAKFDWFDGDRKIERDEMFDLMTKSPGRVRWEPTELHASDVVDTGNATAAFFSPMNLAFDDAVRHGSAVLDNVFAGQPREVVARRCQGFLDRYLNHRFGETQMTQMPYSPGQVQTLSTAPALQPAAGPPPLSAPPTTVPAATAPLGVQPAAPGVHAAQQPVLPAVPSPQQFTPAAAPNVATAPTLQPVQPQAVAPATPATPQNVAPLQPAPQYVYLMAPQPMAPTPAPPQPTAVSEANRDREIARLCQAAQLPERFAYYKAATFMSVQDVAADLQGAMNQQNPLTAQQGPPPAKPAANPDGLDEFRAEYAKNKEFFSDMGITEEAFLETRKIDANNGVELETQAADVSRIVV